MSLNPHPLVKNFYLSHFFLCLFEGEGLGGSGQLPSKWMPGWSNRRGKPVVGETESNRSGTGMAARVDVKGDDAYTGVLPDSGLTVTQFGD